MILNLLPEIPWPTDEEFEKEQKEIDKFLESWQKEIDECSNNLKK
jgi:hypothetical protein